MTEETLQRLARLATPKAGPEEKKAPSLGSSFSPKIGALWRKEDWEGILCRHVAASAAEVEGWFPQLSGVPLGKKRDVLVVKSMKSLRSCEHASPKDRMCAACKCRLCPACFKEICSRRREAFLEQSEEQKMEALKEELQLCDWEARALLRSSTPVVERLSQPAGVPRRRAKQEAEMRQEHAQTTSWWAAPQRHQAGGRATQAFERLTTPREAKPFADIPYLPDMARSGPDANELGINGLESEPLEHALYKLRSERRINALQAGVLLRCATPVFQRLYLNIPGSARRDHDAAPEEERSADE